ncbi:hypothetical protein GCM10009665_64640 [Kitasatospora nipponensis]|uniref:Alpha amylase inhibitor n=1 Tax=Kitasatospora nipponensis TaxID=258049 RepID=A0ABN1WUP5_9ACTN
MALRKKLTGLLTAALVLGGAGAAQLAAAGPAAAQPPCSRSWTASSGQVQCQDFEQYRVLVDCAHDGVPYWVYGPEVTTGAISMASCNSGDQLATPTTPYASVYWEDL